MKKLLYFYPHKFSQFTDGIHWRVVTLLRYFKERGFIVDLVHFENLGIADNYSLQNGLVKDVHLVASSVPERNGPFRSLINKSVRKIKRFLSVSQTKAVNLPNLVNDALKYKLQSLQKENRYDYLLVTYPYWAEIVTHLKAVGFVGRSYIDPTDFLTLQQNYAQEGRLSGVEIGRMFGQEVDRMRLFENIIHISHDELFVFSGFTPKSKHFFIPQFFERRFAADFHSTQIYDVLFIGSDNPYNIEGANWFLNEIYPELDKQIRIAIAGKVCNHINFRAINLTLLGFVEQVDDLYKVSSFTICPLKRGSGMKIKVIESLSYGLPVVSTFKGVDGFYNKIPIGGILIGETDKQFADHINKLKRDRIYYTVQRQAAMKLFEDEFSVEVNFSRLDNAFGPEAAQFGKIQ